VFWCWKSRDSKRLQRIETQLKLILHALHVVESKEETIMGMSEDLLSAVTRCETASTGIIEYLKSLPSETTVAEAISRINADADMLDAAIPANIVTP